MGKTEWARSLGKHIYWMGMKDLNTWDHDAEYLVMDDMPWEFVPDKKAFFGAQRTVSLTAKFKRIRTYDWGKPLIFLCNYNPWHCWDKEPEWYGDRTVVFEITNKMY
jgi:hypothetical protein